MIPLDKLMALKENKYLFTKATMNMVDKIANVKDYDFDKNGKLVSNILELLLNKKVKFKCIKDE